MCSIRITDNTVPMDVIPPPSDKQPLAETNYKPIDKHLQNNQEDQWPQQNTTLRNPKTPISCNYHRYDYSHNCNDVYHEFCDLSAPSPLHNRQLHQFQRPFRSKPSSTIAPRKKSRARRHNYLDKPLMIIVHTAILLCDILSWLLACCLRKF